MVSDMKRASPRTLLCVAAAALLLGWALGSGAALAQQSETPPPQGVSRGENFSAKPAPALFASDCTGGGCHKGPQGLGKNQSQYGLTGFLREHYTNSRESASALAVYLLRTPGAPAAAEGRRGSSRTAARPDGGRGEATREEGVSGPRRTAEPGEKPTERANEREGTSERANERPERQSERAAARAQRGRHAPAATPSPAPASTSEAAPPATPPPPAPPQYDIFD
jgi:hypothetical protein